MKIVIIKLFLITLFIYKISSIVIEKSNAFYNQDYNKWSLDIITSTNDKSLKCFIDISEIILNNNNFDNFKLLNGDGSGSYNDLYLEVQDKYQLKLKLEYYGSFENVYDNIKKEIKDTSKCSSGYYCCDDERNIFTSHNYASNYTIQYLLYEINFFGLDYNFTLTTPDQNKYYSWDNSSSDRDVSVTIQDQSNLINLNQLFNIHYLSIESNNNSNIFFIPKQHVGDDFNKIGISKLKFDSYSSFCNSSSSILTVGNSNDLYDQFHSFRNNSIDRLLYGCSIKTLESSTIVSSSGNDNLILSCDTLNSSLQLYSSLSIDFNSNKFKLLNITGDLEIVSSGIVPISIQYNKYISTLYIDFLNLNNNNEVNVRMNSKYCNNYSDKDNDLVSNRLVIENEKSIIINSGVKKRIEFSIKSREQDISSSGYCIFEIYQNQQFQMDFRLNFTTTIDTYTPDPKFQLLNSNINNLEANIKDSSICPPPKISGTKNGIDYCIDECTIDQQINMVTLLCIPMDCTIKYSTNSPPKSYYNPNTRLCETTPPCPEGYNYLDNSCQKPIATNPPSSSSSSSTSYDCENVNSCGSTLSSDDTIILPNITSSGNATTSSFSLSSKAIAAIFIICCVLLTIVVGFIIRKCCCSRSTNRKIKSDKFKDHYKRPPKQYNSAKKDNENEKDNDIIQDNSEYYSTPPIHPGYPKYILSRVNNNRNYNYNNSNYNNSNYNNSISRSNNCTPRSNNGYNTEYSSPRSNSGFNGSQRSNNGFNGSPISNNGFNATSKPNNQYNNMIRVNNNAARSVPNSPNRQQNTTNNHRRYMSNI